MNEERQVYLAVLRSVEKLDHASSMNWGFDRLSRPNFCRAPFCTRPGLGGKLFQFRKMLDLVVHLR